MDDKNIYKLANLFEAVVSFHIDLNEFDDIMPKIVTVLYNRYCPETKNDIPDVVLPPIYHP